MDDNRILALMRQHRAGIRRWAQGVIDRWRAGLIDLSEPKRGPRPRPTQGGKRHYTPPGPRPSDLVLRVLHRRYAAGESPSLLAHEAGLSKTTIRRYWRELGLTIRPPRGGRRTTNHKKDTK